MIESSGAEDSFFFAVDTNGVSRGDSQACDYRRPHVRASHTAPHRISCLVIMIDAVGKLGLVAMVVLAVVNKW